MSVRPPAKSARTGGSAVERIADVEQQDRQVRGKGRGSAVAASAGGGRAKFKPRGAAGPGAKVGTKKVRRSSR
jgi:hypothetical protein